ncbi:asparagine synthase-related protein, partial [Lactiplantibacillus plantarum]|uniref:asparagine synthase-related protein n=1 Tax=Lactiplantibacillus plantarum TaxID=1590 RepID=UPI001E60C3D9
VPQYFLTKEAVKHVKVCLTGEGADELFGGTILTNLFLNSWWEPLLLFRLGFGFKKKYLRFYVFNYALNSVFVILVVFVISKTILYLDQFMFQSNLFIAFLNSLIMIFFMVVFFSVFYS